jgi:hypothetical protein
MSAVVGACRVCNSVVTSVRAVQGPAADRHNFGSACILGVKGACQIYKGHAVAADNASQRAAANGRGACAVIGLVAGCDVGHT